MIDRSAMMADAGLVFVYALLTAIATGLGALPFLWVSRVAPRTVAIAESIAAGLMLGASTGLLLEGAHFGMPQTLAGAALGLVFIVFGRQALEGREVSLGGIRGGGARKVLLMVGVMTLHSFAEGVAVGVSFGGGQALATLITIAIAVHNVPEGLAISAVMRPKGAPILVCAAWSIFSSLPQPVMAVPAFVFVDLFRPLLPYGLGFAAGAMVFMVFLELLPEAYAAARASTVGLAVSLSLGAMILFQRLL
jgi:zinc transporter ZupT